MKTKPQYATRTDVGHFATPSATGVQSSAQAITEERNNVHACAHKGLSSRGILLPQQREEIT